MLTPRQTNLAPSYGIGDKIFGLDGHFNVGIAGLKINSTIGIMTSGFWSFGLSGLFGFAFPAAGSLHVDTNASANIHSVWGTATGDRIEYPTMSETLREQGTNYFSTASQRTNGGYIAFGGLPPVEFEDDFVTLPVVKVS